MQETWVWSCVGRILWRRERLPSPVFWPGEFYGLQPVGLQRVRYNWATCTFTSEVAVGLFWSFCNFCPEFAPTVYTHDYFQSHPDSLYFVAWEQERYVQVQALQQCREGSQVSTCLIPPWEILHPSSSSSSFFFFFCFFNIYLAALGLIDSCRTQDFHCGIWDLVPWLGIELGPRALGVWGLSHWTTREVPITLFLKVNGPKVSSSETSSCWAGAKDPSLFSRCRSKSLVACPKDRRDLGQSPLGWAEFLEPSWTLLQTIEAWKTWT